VTDEEFADWFRNLMLKAQGGISAETWRSYADPQSFWRHAFLFRGTRFPQDSAQDFSSFGPPQSFLREASALIPRIEKDQRSSAAANIAGQQARIGDLEGALVPVQCAGSPSAQVSATGSITACQKCSVESYVAA
jgi:hypothetical protein